MKWLPLFLTCLLVVGCAPKQEKVSSKRPEIYAEPLETEHCERLADNTRKTFNVPKTDDVSIEYIEKKLVGFANPKDWESRNMSKRQYYTTFRNPHDGFYHTLKGNVCSMKLHLEGEAGNFPVKDKLAEFTAVIVEREIALAEGAGVQASDGYYVSNVYTFKTRLCSIENYSSPRQCKEGSRWCIPVGTIDFYYVANCFKSPPEFMRDSNSLFRR